MAATLNLSSAIKPEAKETLVPWACPPWVWQPRKRSINPPESGFVQKLPCRKRHGKRGLRNPTVCCPGPWCYSAQLHFTDCATRVPCAGIVCSTQVGELYYSGCESSREPGKAKQAHCLPFSTAVRKDLPK